MTNKKEELILVTGLLMLFSLVTNNQFIENDLSRISTIESIVERHTLMIDKASIKPLKDLIYVDSHYYSSKPPLLSVIGSIPYFILEKIGLTIRTHTSITYFLITFTTVGLSSCLLGLFFYRSLTFWNLEKKVRIYITIALMCATPIFNYSTTFNNHTVAAMLIFTSFYLLLQTRKTNQSISTYLKAGGIIGLSTGIDIPSGLLFTAIFLIYLISSRKNSIKIALFIIGVIIPLSISIYLNMIVTKDILPPILHPEYYSFQGSSLQFNEGNIDGLGEHEKVPSRLEYILNALFGIHGFFSNTPILLFAVFMMFSNAVTKTKQMKEAVLLSIGCIILSVFYLTFTSGYGGNSYHFRWLIPIIPLMFFYIPTYFTSKRTETEYQIFFIAFFTSLFVSIIRLLPWNHSPWAIFQQWDFMATIIVSIIMSITLVFNPPVKEYLMSTARKMQIKEK